MFPSCCIVQRVLPLSHDGLDLKPDLVHHWHQWEYGARLLYLDAKLIYSNQYLHSTAVTMSVKKAGKRVGLCCHHLRQFSSMHSVQTSGLPASRSTMC